MIPPISKLKKNKKKKKKLKLQTRLQVPLLVLWAVDVR